MTAAIPIVDRGVWVRGEAMECGWGRDMWAIATEEGRGRVMAGTIDIAEGIGTGIGIGIGACA